MAQARKAAKRRKSESARAADEAYERPRDEIASPLVRALQQLLVDAGAKLFVDGIDGPRTRAAMQSLDAEGREKLRAALGSEFPEEEIAAAFPELAGEAPTEEITEAPGGIAPMPDGKQIPEVRELQELLLKHGARLSLDGVLGPETRAACRSLEPEALVAVRQSLQERFPNTPVAALFPELARAEPQPERTPEPPEERDRPGARETAPFHSDQPALRDRLNRKAVAEAIGTVIDDVWREQEPAGKRSPRGDCRDEDRSFIIHLHGRWGSGKTSILNFLREVLLSGDVARPSNGKPKDPAWIVVDYNAWRHQRLGPAWWSLMETVYRDAVSQLGGITTWRGLSLIARQSLWRLRIRWLEKLGVAILAGLVVIVLLSLPDQGGWTENLKTAGAVVAALGGVFTIMNRLSLDSAQTAQRYMELAGDPLTPLVARYSALVEDIGRPVAVFIDDLDRCHADWVVELLQTIQTLFRGARVLYVVAADRDWVCSSYEQGYGSFSKEVGEPGRSLGHLFLEKVFQLSVEVPRLSEPQRDAYWSELITSGGPSEPAEEKQIEREIRAEVAGLDTEEELIAVVDRHRADPRRAAIVGAQVFRRMQAAPLVAEREHLLARYAKYLEPNPRAMKRLLNAYGFRRGFDIQSSQRAAPDPLIRWTILETRWPILADHLAERSPAATPDDRIRALMSDPEVRAVSDGLTWEQLRAVAGAPQPRHAA